MNTDSNENYNKVVEIRNQAIERLEKAKEVYIDKGNPDELILAMYDLEIEFLQKSLVYILNTSN